MPRHTARGLVVRDGKVLLMERWRDGLHYFSIPGGGIEPGEEPEQTAVREIREETTIDAKPTRLVIEMHDGDSIHSIYLCDYLDGEPALPPDSPEAQENNPRNAFEPRWIPLDEVADLPFVYWQPIKETVISGLTHGFPAEVAIVQAPTTR